MRAAHMRMAKESDMCRRENDKNIAAIQNFFLRIFNCHWTHKN